MRLARRPTSQLASDWADRLLPTLRNVLRERQRGTFAFSPGTPLCCSALFRAGRHDELLDLLGMDPRPIWPYVVWGAQVLVARGQVDEAFTYARDRAGSTTSLETIARLAEETLLQAGRRAEAFDRYALLAKQAGSNQSTVRALAREYPELAPDKLLAHLIASTPGEPGKWFATAKTLTRAARDHLTEQPAFSPCRPRWRPCMGCRWAMATNSPDSMSYKRTGLPRKRPTVRSSSTRRKPSSSR